ncbi:MAG TPA: hypothetical protein VF228_12680 [Iamia sp.]
MTLLDDDIDALLHAFRADEALLDDSTRTRMWARICDDVPDAPAALELLAPPARVRRLRSPAHTSPRILAVAAVVLALLAVAGIALRSGPGDNAVTAGSVPTELLPRDLQAMADVLTVRTGPTLGSSPGTRYSHLVTERTLQGGPSSEVTVTTEETWIALDGGGRVRVTGDEDSDELLEPGRQTLATVAPADLVGLPDDPDALVAAMVASGGLTAEGSVAEPVIDALAHAGLPGPVHAAMIRYLDRLGFVPVTAPEDRPNLSRVEGPGPDGSVLQADFDLRTGQVVASSLLASPTRVRDDRTYTVADLRADRGR